MARKIQIKRGNKAQLPTLSQGELALCLDEQSLYAGGSSGNIPIGGKAITPALIGAATTAQVNSAASAAAAAQTTANAAVKKSGDFMTGSLHAVAFGTDGAEAYAGLSVDNTHKGARIMSSDNTAQGCALIVSTSKGLLFIDPNSNVHPVYHAGNPPDIAVHEGDTFGTLVAEGYDAPSGGIAYRVRLFAIDDYARGCALILYPGKGVYVTDGNGNEYEIIHAGNISKYTG